MAETGPLPRLSAVRLTQELKREGLLDPPPYAYDEKAQGWTAGYEAAIADITARYALTPSRVREGFSRAF